MTPKNKITLYTGCGEEKRKVELFDFTKVDHYFNKSDGKAYLRILCGNKFYYFLSVISVISSVEIYGDKSK